MSGINTLQNIDSFSDLPDPTTVDSGVWYIESGSLAADYVTPSDWDNTANEYTTWRSLYDGIDVKIPDTAVIQLNGQETNTISESGGGIDGWTDRVTGNELTGSAAGFGDINGNQAIAFTNGGDGLQSSAFSDVSPPWTAFVVLETSGGSNKWIWTEEDDNTPGSRYANSRWEYNRDGSTVIGSSDASVQLLTYVEDGTDATLRENGGATVNTASSGGNETITPLSIGNRSSLDAYWDDEIGFFELHDTELTGSDLTDRESDIADLWDISL